MSLAMLGLGSAADPIDAHSGSSRTRAIGHAEGERRFDFYLEAFAIDGVKAGFGGRDPVRETDLRGSPFVPDAITVPGWKLGRYRRQGPHLIALQNQDLSKHMRELEQHVPEVVPADFTGVVVIDYEPWWALWDRTANRRSSGAVDARDIDFQDDWRDYIRDHRAYLLDGLTGAEQEEVYKRTYEAFVRTFFLATFYKCKQLRPRAQWSYYNYPQVMIHSDLTPTGVLAYGDLSHEASRLNDQQRWLYDAVDVVVPRIYPARKVIEDWPTEERVDGEVSPEWHERWLASMIQESVRLANGKPVIPKHSAIYFSSKEFERTPVTQFHHEEVYRILAENGADGVIVWHSVGTLDELALWDVIWPDYVRPAAIRADQSIKGSP